MAAVLASLGIAVSLRYLGDLHAAARRLELVDARSRAVIYIEGLLRDPNALQASKALGGSQALRACIDFTNTQDCHFTSADPVTDQRGTYRRTYPFTLADPERGNAIVASASEPGFLTTGGTPCTSASHPNCLFEVRVSFRADCDGATLCDRASSIAAFYSIRPRNAGAAPPGAFTLTEASNMRPLGGLSASSVVAMPDTPLSISAAELGRYDAKAPFALCVSSCGGGYPKAVGAAFANQCSDKSYALAAGCVGELQLRCGMLPVYFCSR